MVKTVPVKNVKKLVKKQVKRAEKKAHPNRVKRNQRIVTRERVRQITKGAGKGVVAKINAMAAGATAERRAAAQLAKKLCCPNMFESFAIQDGFNSTPVGVANPYMVNAMPFTTSDGNSIDGLGIGNAESWIFAFRDPHRTLLYYDPVARTWEYNGVTDTGSTTITMASGNDLDIFDAWNFSSGNNQHGSKLYTGVVNTGRGAGVRWTLCDKLKYIKISGLPASTSTIVTIQTLVNDEMYNYTITATSTAGGVGTFPLNTAVALANAPALANFFHLHIAAVNQTITNGTVSIGATAQPGFKQFSLAQFDQLNQVVEKLRFTALNVMYSNTAQELYKGGFGFGRQVPSNLDPFTIALGGFDAWANKPEATRLGIRNGIMTFYKASDITDFEFMDIGDPADNGSGGGNYIIDSTQDYLMLALSQPVGTERGGYLSIFTNVEYKHNNVWFPLVRPDHTRRVFEDALEIAGNVPAVHENPFHIKDIFNWIGRHKNQIQQTINMGAQALGGARYEGYANKANSFLDIWFK